MAKEHSSGAGLRGRSGRRDAGRTKAGMHARKGRRTIAAVRGCRLRARETAELLRVDRGRGSAARRLDADVAAKGGGQGAAGRRHRPPRRRIHACTYWKPARAPVDDCRERHLGVTRRCNSSIRIWARSSCSGVARSNSACLHDLWRRRKARPRSRWPGGHHAGGRWHPLAGRSYWRRTAIGSAACPPRSGTTADGSCSGGSDRRRPRCVRPAPFQRTDRDVI